MTVAKRDIVEMLLARGDCQRAIRADEELPELVHVDLHARLLLDLGLEPASLVTDLRETPRIRTLAGRA